MPVSFNINQTAQREGWLSQLDARTKMLVCIMAAIATIAFSSAWAQSLLLVVSLLYFLSLKRWRITLYSYLAMSAMLALSFACLMLIAQWVPALGKGVNIQNLSVPFMRGCTMMNVVLALAFSTRIQSILHSLQSLKLPFCIYLPAAVMIRFIPTFVNDIQQVWESLKIRGWQLNAWTCTLHPVLTTRLLFTPLLFRSLKTSDELGIAAELKGLGYASSMQQYKVHRWTSYDWTVVVLTFITFLAAIALQIYLPTASIGAMR